MSEYPVSTLSFWPAVNTAVWRSSIAPENRFEASERRRSFCEGRFLNSSAETGSRGDPVFSSAVGVEVVESGVREVVLSVVGGFLSASEEYRRSWPQG